MNMKCGFLEEGDLKWSFEDPNSIHRPVNKDLEGRYFPWSSVKDFLDILFAREDALGWNFMN
jgi:hypothetical protein